ncbi:MAG: hypothetical protein Q9166_006719 [cf. Caloplaca sp. 2 TL-2023]
MEIIGGVSGVLTIVASVTKLSKKLNEIRDSYNSVALNIQLAAIQLATIRDALEDIAEWRLKVQSETKAAKKLDATLADSLKGCAVLITVIDSKLGEAGYAPGLKGKIRHMWLEDVLKGYISNLDGQVRALQLLLTSNQMGTFADIIHHLEKAEAREVFEQVRADTASLTVGNKDLEDAASVLSYDPSVIFEMDEILMRHPAYQAAYGKLRRPPLQARPSQDQIAKEPSSPIQANAKLLDKPIGSPAGTTLSSPPNQRDIKASQSEVAHGKKPEGRQHTDESLNTISPSDAYSTFSTSLAPAPLAIAKNAPRSEGRRAADTSHSSAAEDFKGQHQSAFNEPATAETTKPDVQLHAPQSNRESSDLEMISLLPLASHFDISRKPKDGDKPTHRLPVCSRNNDRRMIRQKDSRSGLSVHSGHPSPPAPPEVSLPTQQIKVAIASTRTTEDANAQATEQAIENPEGESISRSGSKRRKSRGEFSKIPSVRGLKRPPSTDSDLYDSSITDKKITVVQESNTLSAASGLVKSNNGEGLPSRTSFHDRDLGPGRTRSESDHGSSSSGHAEPKSTQDLSDGQQIADDSTAASDEPLDADTTSTATKVRPPVPSHTAPAILPPPAVSDRPTDSPEQLETQNVRPRSSTAQDFRRCQPFRKPVPSNSLRRSELSSPDYVKYSDAEHHGLKIVLTPDSDTRQRNNSTPAPPAFAPPPPPPIRPPPSVPGTISNPLATLAPTNSLDITRRWSNESSPAQYMMSGGLASPVEGDESVNETMSTVSSSDRSDRQTLSSAMTSATNTTGATSHPQPADSVRSKAQEDLHKLQLQLSAAKSRGDSTAQKASLQQSMEIIKKAYLSQSAAKAIHPTQTGTSPPKAKSNRMSLKGKKSVSLLAMVNRKSKQADLHEAARSGDNDTLRSLLEEKVSINVRGDGDTPLMEAAKRSHLHCLQTLKEFGADEFAIDGSGRNVLHMAVVADQPKAVEWLIQAYPPTSPDVPKQKSSRLAWATEAISGSRSSKILLEASDGEGSRPLHIAAKLGMLSMVSLLLNQGSDIEAKDNWGRTSLIDAVMHNRLDIVILLMDRGADISPQDVEGMTAIHWAAKINHLGVLNSLISRGNALFRSKDWFQDWFNKNGDLPIHSAARNGYVESVSLLKGSRSSSDLQSIHTKHGETLLHIAALANHLSLAKELIRGNVEVNVWAKPHSYHLRLWAHDETGYNPKALPLPYNIIPLHYACTRGYFEMTELLLENGAWVNAAPDDDNTGKSPLMMAVESGSTNLVCLLLARGAKVNAAVPATLWTALHIACRRGDLETTRELIRYGAKTTARTKDSRTPEELVQKVKDSKKKSAMETYCNELTRQRYAKVKAQMAENRQNADPRAHPSLTPQPTPSPVPQQITYVYPPGTVLPGMAVPTQFMDYANDAFPEAPPAYTAGTNVPRNLANRPGMNRQHYG